MQYVGKTVDEFCLQWNKYKDNNKKYLKKEACMQQHLFEGFWSEGHSGWFFFFDDASIIFINKTDPKDSTRTLLSKQNFFP